MLTDILGGESKALQMDRLGNPMAMPNELSLMTVNDFEAHFIQEITEKVSQADVLTVRDIKKIRLVNKKLHKSLR